MKKAILKKKNNCSCVFCENNHDFELPKQIITALLEDKLVLFAGAGISTEANLVFPFTFYESIKEELKIGQDKDISFPALMSKFCEASDGRAKLLQRIKERFDYLKAFPELYRNATRFHKELSTIFEIKNIITTNWDTSFEDECGAIPMVNGSDFAFWDNPGRKVFKIHGSINNMGSIIATEEDYVKVYHNLNSGIIGSSLKLLLATKTVLFVGYSFKDNDFNKIYSFLKKEMKDIIPRSFIVTPRKAPQGFNGTVINTDGTYFIENLKKYLVKNKRMINDDKFNEVYRALFEIQEAHSFTSKIDYKKNPCVIYCTSYQDGMIHAYERILSLKKTGYYSHVCNIIKTFDNYEILRKEKVKNKKYFDVAYIDGYLNGISFLWAPKKIKNLISMFYIYGSDKFIKTSDDFLKVLQKSEKIHKNAYKLAQKITNEFNSDILHHTPFLS